jgi:hypothetical protein
LTNWNSQKDQSLRENRNFAMSKEGVQNLKQHLAEQQYQQNAFQNRFQQDFITQKPKQNQFYEPIKLNLHENFTPLPTISKVKLNKLNTNDFFTNSAPRSSQNYEPYSYQNYSSGNYHDAEVAASDL